MREKHPLEGSLDQVAEMLNKIRDHKGPIIQNITPEVLKELERLEKAVAKFDELNKKSYKAANVDIERLKTEFNRYPKASEKDKQIVKRIREIDQDARELQFAYARALATINQTASLRNEDKIKKKQGKDRRKKFKRLGENKNWIPL